MRNGNRWITVGLLAMFAAFFAGAAHLFLLRYEVGDVYPPYSTLRSDPLGTKALYEALERIPSITTERNTRDMKRLSVSPPPTVFILGVPPELAWWEETQQSADALAAIMHAGGRLVVAFAPTRTYSGDEDLYTQFRNSQSEEEEKRRSRLRGRGEDGEEDGEDLGKPVDLREVWKIDVDRPKSPTGDGQEDRRDLEAMSVPGETLPSSLEWHSIAYFKPSDAAWKTLYECDGKPVAVQREIGDGTLVMLTDSYLFSNEAMRKSPETEVIARLMGPSERAVFDEMHLGISERQGVMTLARKYGLHGFVFGFAALVLLFFWRNLVRLTPPYEDEFDQSAWYSKGREAAEGLTNLLRRSIKPSDLLGTCVNEWKRAVGMRRPDSQKKLEKMQTVLDAHAAGNTKPVDLVLAYREMVRITTERK
ncbi:MAG: DUF4350 domain-containing protein [Candidatus Hydrogenedentes bacterium]|nr:DUF4350 domain-containing protein [Candidatus Hydrogenedentota bacterium]